MAFESMWTGFRQSFDKTFNSIDEMFDDLDGKTTVQVRMTGENVLKVKPNLTKAEIFAAIHALDQAKASLDEASSAFVGLIQSDAVRETMRKALVQRLGELTLRET